MEQKLKCDVYIGKNLRRLREKFGLSQEKLCAELQCRNCDIGRSTYAKYENGVRPIPFERVIKLALFYDVSIDYIAGLTNDKRGRGYKEQSNGKYNITQKNSPKAVIKIKEEK